MIRSDDTKTPRVSRSPTPKPRRRRTGRPVRRRATKIGFFRKFKAKRMRNRSFAVSCWAAWCGSDGFGRSANTDTEFTQPTNVVSNEPLSLLFTHRNTALFFVGGPALKYKIHENQDVVSHGNYCLQTVFRGDAPELFSQMTIFLPGNRPGTFGQRGLQPAVPFSRARALVLSSAAVVARTDSSPRTQLLFTAERRYIGSDFGQHNRGCRLLNTGNGLQQLPLLLVTGFLDLLTDQ